MAGDTEEEKAQNLIDLAANLSEFTANETRTMAERKWAYHRLLRIASDPKAEYPTTEMVLEHTRLYKENLNNA